MLEGCRWARSIAQTEGYAPLRMGQHRIQWDHWRSLVLPEDIEKDERWWFEGMIYDSWETGGVLTGQEDFLRQVELATSYESLALLPNISILSGMLIKVNRHEIE